MIYFIIVLIAVILLQRIIYVHKTIAYYEGKTVAYKEMRQTIKKYRKVTMLKKKTQVDGKDNRCIDYKLHITCPHGKTVCEDCDATITVCACKNHAGITKVICWDCQEEY